MQRPLSINVLPARISPISSAIFKHQLADTMISVWEIDLPLGSDYQPIEQRARTVAAGG
jgi:hypothetical protein